MLEQNLDEGMDEDELNAYLISDHSEVNQRQLEWTILNKDFLVKESLKRAKEEDDSNSVSSKSNIKPVSTYFT